MASNFYEKYFHSKVLELKSYFSYQKYFFAAYHNYYFPVKVENLTEDIYEFLWNKNFHLIQPSLWIKIVKSCLYIYIYAFPLPLPPPYISFLSFFSSISLPLPINFHIFFFFISCSSSSSSSSLLFLLHFFHVMFSVFLCLSFYLCYLFSLSISVFLSMLFYLMIKLTCIVYLSS